MAQSFFGGDPNVAHFSCDVKYRLPGETSQETNVRRREQSKILKATGIDYRLIFRFRVGDETGKAIAKANADLFASNLAEKTGVPVEVFEGCFL